MHILLNSMHMKMKTRTFRRDSASSRAAGEPSRATFMGPAGVKLKRSRGKTKKSTLPHSASAHVVVHLLSDEFYLMHAVAVLACVVIAEPRNRSPIIATFK